jgi:AmmeMemoRadiSam system protein B
MTNHMRFHDRWYPADPASLAALLEVRAGRPDPERERREAPEEAGRRDALHTSATAAGARSDRAAAPLLAVLPHAGLSYSARGQRAFWAASGAASGAASTGTGVATGSGAGAGAGTGPRAGERPGTDTGAGDVALRDRIDAVVIVAPSHYVPLPADTTVAAPFTAHETPFGDLPGLALAGDRMDRETVEDEHAVELLLPGVAYHLGRDLPVGAVVVGPVTGAAAARTVARRLLDSLDALGVRRPLWLVSSDATHYGPGFRWEPWGRGTWRNLAAQVYADDAELIGAGIAGRSDAFWDRLQRPSTVCGRYALGLALAALEIQEERGTLRRGTGAILEYYSSAGDLDSAGAGGGEGAGRGGSARPRGITDSGHGDGDAREFVCYATAEITGTWRVAE